MLIYACRHKCSSALAIVCRHTTLEMSTPHVWRNLADALVTHHFHDKINNIWETVTDYDRKQYSRVQLSRWEFIVAAMMHRRQTNKINSLHLIFSDKVRPADR